MVFAGAGRYNADGKTIFDDENPRYVLDDLKWFAEYFSIHTKVEIDESKIPGAIILSFSSSAPKNG